MSIHREMIVALALSAAIIVIAIALFSRPARSDGYLLPGPPPPQYYSLPVPLVQGPPSQSCVETAIQLAYQTGSRAVGNAAAAACRYYAPVRSPAQSYYGPPLGGYPIPVPPPPY